MSRFSAKAVVYSLSLAGLVLVGSGCGSGGPGLQPYNLVADLQVTWGINGVDDPIYCDLFGIDQWAVTANGPESRRSLVDCRANIWSSEGDFFAISEGNYQIIVDALSGGGIVASQSVNYTLIDDGGVQPLFFDFPTTDFGVPFPF